MLNEVVLPSEKVTTTCPPGDSCAVPEMPPAEKVTCGPPPADCETEVTVTAPVDKAFAKAAAAALVVTTDEVGCD